MNKKILLLGDDPHYTSGYANILRNLMKYLSARGYTCEHLGRVQRPSTIEKIDPDLVFVIGEPWDLPAFPHLLVPYVAYVPIDSDYIPNAYPGKNVPTKTLLHYPDHIVTFSPWAQHVLKRSTGIQSEFIPHAIDPAIFYPHTDRETLRKKHFNLDDDTFLIGTVSRNQPRKNMPLLFQALNAFVTKYKSQRNIKMYFHCPLKDLPGASELEWLARYYNVADYCLFNDDLKGGAGVGETVMNEYYNCFDVHLSMSGGEGWHLPSLEASAVGVQTIIPANSAPFDWGSGFLNFSSISARTHDPNSGHIRVLPDIHDTAQKLYYLYSKPTVTDHAMIEKVHEDFTWRSVAMQWDTYFKKVCYAEHRHAIA